MLIDEIGGCMGLEIDSFARGGGHGGPKGAGATGEFDGTFLYSGKAKGRA